MLFFGFSAGVPILLLAPELIHDSVASDERWTNFDPRLPWLGAQLEQLHPQKVLVIAASAETALDIALLRAAMLEHPMTDAARDAIARGAAAEFPVRAADLMPAYSGPALGARIKELEARWIASEFRLGRDELLT